jgi:metal-responsive CopG/Arc/MetJ family transcriptional regulator
MAEPARKLNFMISLDVANELESLVPHGQRSKVVSEAIRKELVRYKRWKLTEKLLAIRSNAPPVRGKLVEKTIVADQRRA